jgi:sec-independent protein translocase protein TatB
MLDIGWAELLVIGVVALIVIGPKDLPDMFRQLGRFMAKIRSMGRDFQRAMDEAARQSGVSDVAKDLKTATSAKAMGLEGLRSAADKFEKWDPIKNAAKPTVPLKPSTPITAAPAAEMTPVSTLTQASSLSSAGAAAVTEAAPAKVVGPETQALIDKQAAKAAALRDYSAKLKAIDAGTLSPVGVVPPAYEPEAPAAKPARKPRAKKLETSVDVPAEKPRRVAKKKADEA